jgi:hypothetical protein
MNAEWSKTIGTVAIWMGMAISILGISQISDGDVIVLCVISMVVGATVSTTVIWAPWTLKDRPDHSHGFEVIQPASKIETK